MLNIEKHQTFLYRILNGVYRHPLLSQNLGFKGGTALYFLYNLSRFSTDLDFDLLHPDQATAVFEQLQLALRELGQIKEADIKRQTIFLLFSYEAYEHNIKVEVSSRQFPNEYENKNLYGLPLVVLKKEFMFAHKLVALTDRRALASRDLYDIYFFLSQGWGIQEAIIQARTGKTLPEYFRYAIDFIEKNVHPQNVLQGLGEVLDPKQKSWAKQHLKTELLQLLNLRLASVQSG